MNRREFSIGAGCVIAVAGLGLPALLQAQVRPPESGTEYMTLKNRVPVEAPAGKVEVIEFFWYSCPHCNAFEPRLQAWIQKLPADVSFKRVPVAFREAFVAQQRLFYTLEAMGKVDDLHGKVFQAIHELRQPTNTEELILAWAAKQPGLDLEKFRQLFRSPEVNNRSYRALQIQDAYGVEGVPALGIAGRYYTDGTIAGNMERALQVTDHLVAQTRAAR